MRQCFLYASVCSASCTFTVYLCVSVWRGKKKKKEKKYAWNNGKESTNVKYRPWREYDGSHQRKVRWETHTSRNEEREDGQGKKEVRKDARRSNIYALCLELTRSKVNVLFIGEDKYHICSRHSGEGSHRAFVSLPHTHTLMCQSCSFINWRSFKWRWSHTHSPTYRWIVRAAINDAYN